MLLSASQIAAGVPEDITLLVGPLLLGYLVNALLFGILLCQVYLYHLSFPNDRISIKVLVYSLFFLDTLQSALTTHNAWHFLSRGWGDVGVLADPGWSWIAVPLFSGIISSAVQLFYAWRIFVLSHNYFLCVFICVLSLAQGISAMTSGIWFAILNDITKITRLFPSATVWLGGSALTDFIITVSMCYLLRKAATGQRSTDKLLIRIMRLTVETGMITTFAATLELILFLHFGTNNLHMIPALGLAKLYTNTLLCTLNARSPALGGGLGQPGRTNVSVSGAGKTGGGNWNVRSAQTGNISSADIKFAQSTTSASTRVMISRETVTDVDSVPMDELTKHDPYSSFIDDDGHRKV